MLTRYQAPNIWVSIVSLNLNNFANKHAKDLKLSPRLVYVKGYSQKKFEDVTSSIELVTSPQSGEQQGY